MPNPTNLVVSLNSSEVQARIKDRNEYVNTPLFLENMKKQVIFGRNSRKCFHSTVEKLIQIEELIRLMIDGNDELNAYLEENPVNRDELQEFYLRLDAILNPKNKYPKGMSSFIHAFNNMSATNGHSMIQYFWDSNNIKLVKHFDSHHAKLSEIYKNFLVYRDGKKEVGSTSDLKNTPNLKDARSSYFCYLTSCFSMR